MGSEPSSSRGEARRRPPVGRIELLLLEAARQHGYRLVKVEDYREPEEPPSIH
jgi:hypothetical protein